MSKRDERDPTRGSGPWIMDRWIHGKDNAGRRKPKWNRPYKGVMLDPEIAALEARGDKLYAYGELIAERTPTGLAIQMAAANQTVASATRKLARRCSLWDTSYRMVGPNGTALQAGEIMLSALVENTTMAIGKANKWSGEWRVKASCEEIEIIVAYSDYGLDLTPIIEVLTTLKAVVSLGRMSSGWTEDMCRNCNNAIMKAQHRVEPHLEVAA